MSVIGQAHEALLDAMVDTPERFARSICVAYQNGAWRLVRLLVERLATAREKGKSLAFVEQPR